MSDEPMPGGEYAKQSLDLGGGNKYMWPEQDASHVQEDFMNRLNTAINAVTLDRNNLQGELNKMRTVTTGTTQDEIHDNWNYGVNIYQQMIDNDNEILKKLDHYREIISGAKTILANRANQCQTDCDNETDYSKIPFITGKANGENAIDWGHFNSAIGPATAELNALAAKGAALAPLAPDSLLPGKYPGMSSDGFLPKGAGNPAGSGFNMPSMGGLGGGMPSAGSGGMPNIPSFKAPENINQAVSEPLSEQAASMSVAGFSSSSFQDSFPTAQVSTGTVVQPFGSTGQGMIGMPGMVGNYGFSGGLVNESAAGINRAVNTRITEAPVPVAVREKMIKHQIQVVPGFMEKYSDFERLCRIAVARHIMNRPEYFTRGGYAVACVKTFNGNYQFLDCSGVWGSYQLPNTVSYVLNVFRRDCMSDGKSIDLNNFKNRLKGCEDPAFVLLTLINEYRRHEPGIETVCVVTSIAPQDQTIKLNSTTPIYVQSDIENEIIDHLTKDEVMFSNELQIINPTVAAGLASVMPLASYELTNRCAMLGCFITDQITNLNPLGQPETARRFLLTLTQMVYHKATADELKQFFHTTLLNARTEVNVSEWSVNCYKDETTNYDNTQQIMWFNYVYLIKNMMESNLWDTAIFASYHLDEDMLTRIAVLGETLIIEDPDINQIMDLMKIENNNTEKIGI